MMTQGGWTFKKANPAKMEEYFDRLWPICRSITGKGFRDSLSILAELVPFDIEHVASGTRVFDWTVPDEWNIDEAYIEDSSGKRIIDFKNNNLHVVSYSEPVDACMTLDELSPHLYSLPDLPDAIPYLTTYYKKRWGFCLSDTQKKSLKPGMYRAVIRARLAPGQLTYGHCYLPASNGGSDEVLLSSYLCHPSLANNELSGPLTLAFLYEALSKVPNRRYNYRFVVVPETIGSITYLAKYGDSLKKHCKAGLVLTCCGDNRRVTYKKSRHGDSAIDKCALNVLRHHTKERNQELRVHDFFPIGSDERQYSSPGFNLPVGSIMRSMYGSYVEYHTSLDDKSFVSFTAMAESVDLYMNTLQAFEYNQVYRNLSPYGEPMLSPRGLYPDLGSQKDNEEEIRKILYMLNFSDGTHTLLDIAEKADVSAIDLIPLVEKLIDRGLLAPEC